MTQQTINLYDGLEALYYMDPTYFDGTANEIKDKSGHGRHAQASGGPTIGVNGPDSFEATSFDGSDDKFDVGEPLDSSEALCIFCVAKPNSVNGVTRIADTDDGAGFALRFDNGEIDFFVRDASGGGPNVEFNDVNTGTFYSIVAVWTGQKIQLIINGDLKGETSVSTRSTATSNLTIGAATDNSEFVNGDIATYAQWHRSLSDAELEYLNRLTAPRRAQL